MMFLALLWLHPNKDLTVIFIIIWIIYSLPAFYLHIEYYYYNRGEKYRIVGDKLTQYKNGKERCIGSNDIELITVYLAPNLYLNSSLRYLPIESYYYAKVKLKNKSEIILTCLLTPKLEKVLNQLEGVVIKREKRLFNTIVKTKKR